MKKPFNLEEALAGRPVVTRDGRAVEVKRFDCRPDCWSDRNIVGALFCEQSVEPLILRFNSLGVWTNSCTQYDLFMVSVEKTVWVNLYLHQTPSGLAPASYFLSQDEADCYIHPVFAERVGGKAFPITYEE